MPRFPVGGSHVHHNNNRAHFDMKNRERDIYIERSTSYCKLLIFTWHIHVLWVDRGSSVGIATNLRSRRSGDRIPVLTKFVFLFTTNPSDRLWAPSIFPFIGYQNSLTYRGVKFTRYLHLFDDVGEGWSYTSTSPIRLHTYNLPGHVMYTLYPLKYMTKRRKGVLTP